MHHGGTEITERNAFNSLVDHNIEPSLLKPLSL